MNELALFAGAGGGILGGHLLGWRTICAVERDAYAASVLVARQNDGILSPFPIWDDVQTFDGGPWRGFVDVISGGFPCQDISAAGRGAGIDGERSGMWAHMARIIREVRPRFVFVENSPMLVSRGLGRVLGDLASLGFDAKWCVLGAIDAGAPHERERIWIRAERRNVLPHADDRRPIRRQQQPESAQKTPAEQIPDADHHGHRIKVQLLDEPNRNATPDTGRHGSLFTLADADRSGLEKQRGPVADGAQHQALERGRWWATEPQLDRMAYGVAARVDRIRALGNGQVPAVAALAWETLTADRAR